MGGEKCFTRVPYAKKETVGALHTRCTASHARSTPAAKVTARNPGASAQFPTHSGVTIALNGGRKSNPTVKV